MSEPASDGPVPGHDYIAQAASAVRYCADADLTPFVLVAHYPVAGAGVQAVLDHPQVAGLVLPPGEADAIARPIQDARLGRYLAADYTWQLPAVSARCVALLGPRSNITYRMAREARRAGARWLAYVAVDGWQRESVRTFIARKFVEKGAAMLGRVKFAFVSRSGALVNRLSLRANVVRAAARLRDLLAAQGRVGDLRARLRARLPSRWIAAGEGAVDRCQLRLRRLATRVLAIPALHAVRERLLARAAARAGAAGMPPTMVRVALDLSRAQPLGEVRDACMLPAPPHVGRGDTLHNPLSSAWLLLEDGVPMLQAHATHDDIRQQGHGRWSHWGRTIYLSSTDGSDPRSNGRRYELVAATPPTTSRGLLRRRRSPFLDLIEGSAALRLPATEFVAGRILLVNSSLGSGGAERQVVNTLIGLKRRGYHDISLLCEHLHDRPDHDFYLWLLEQEGIVASQVDRTPKTAVSLFTSDTFAGLTPLIAQLPLDLRDEVCFFARELLASRPQVVHAWQDQTSIKVGLAAALVGVPCIVLGSRNLPPYHFHFYLSYMAPAYRALARLDAVVFTNNSRRGARDYETWLDLAPETYHVVFNGIDTERIARADAAAAAAYRSHLGIPAEAPVVGGMFRLYPEKDPLLWVRTARATLTLCPDAWFVLIGAGIMDDEIRRQIIAQGLDGRVIMPGTEKNSALALSIMDVFLLTSKQEGTPNVVIEAQMLGIPVVATDAGGTADSIVDGETGFIVHARRPQVLAEKLAWCLRQDAWRAQVRDAAPRFATGRFGFETMIDTTLRTYGLPPHQAPCCAGDAAGALHDPGCVRPAANPSSSTDTHGNLP